MSDSKSKEVNSQIREYWLSKKKEVLLRRLSKNKVPSFTRHNGRRIKRLKRVWRSPKGSHGNKLTVPKIGYKRPDHLRFRRSSDGLLFRVVKNKKDLSEIKLKEYEVFVFSAVLGARKRKELLEHAKELQKPVYITKKR